MQRGKMRATNNCPANYNTTNPTAAALSKHTTSYSTNTATLSKRRAASLSKLLRTATQTLYHAMPQEAQWKET